MSQVDWCRNVTWTVQLSQVRCDVWVCWLTAGVLRHSPVLPVQEGHLSRPLEAHWRRERGQRDTAVARQCPGEWTVVRWTDGHTVRCFCQLDRGWSCFRVSVRFICQQTARPLL